jgi:uncharacterized membrane protein YdjX (TVP38/TMEM64 family)
MKFAMAAFVDPAPNAIDTLSFRLKGILSAEPVENLNPSGTNGSELEPTPEKDKAAFWFSLPSTIPFWRSVDRVEEEERIEERVEITSSSTSEGSEIEIMVESTETAESLLTTTTRTAVESFRSQLTLVNILKTGLALTIFGGTLAIFIGFFIKDSFAQRGVQNFLEWAQSLPYILATLALSGIYAVSLALLLPMTPFNLAAGFLFNYHYFRGVLAALMGYFFGQTLSYWLANTLMKTWIEGKLQEKEKQYKTLRAVRLALASNGFKLLIISHLSPIFPAGILNYLFSLSPLSFSYYTVGSLLGVIPSIMMMTMVGSALGQLSSMWSGDNPTSTTESILWGLAAIAVTVLVVMAFAYFAKKELAKIQEAEGTGDEESAEMQPTDEGDREVQNQSLISPLIGRSGANSNYDDSSSNTTST